MLKVEISYTDMQDMQLATDLSENRRCDCGYSLACMSCPWRPNTWEKVAWLQVRVSSMVVPLAHAEEKEKGGERGKVSNTASCKDREKEERGKE